MSCRIHEDIDLAHYLLDPRAGGFDAFRRHYPGCPECSNALRVWTAIEHTLAQPPDAQRPPDGRRAGTGPAPWHPEPEALARYAGGSGPTGSEAEIMHRHIEHCPRCRTEWLALERFDFAAAQDAPWSSPTAAARATRGDESRLASWLRSLGLDAAWAGLAAGALVVALLVVFAWLAMSPERGGARHVGQLVEGGALPPSAPGLDAPAAPMSPAGGSVQAPAAVPVEVPEIAGRLAADVERAAPLRESQVRLDAPAATPAAESVQLVGTDSGGGAPRTVTAVDDRRAGDRSDAGEAPAQPVVGDDVLLASLSNMPPPAYAAPAGASQLAWMHQFGSVRSGARGPDAAQVHAHAPDHVGLTSQASPRLWWSLDAPALQPVVITLVDDREIDPLLEATLDGPQAEGPTSISLADHGVVLEPGVEYRWFVTLVVDEERPSRNPISAGSIKRVVPDAETQRALASSEPAEQGHALAKAGYWYDAYDFFASLCQRHPGVVALGSHRDRLLADSTLHR